MRASRYVVRQAIVLLSCALVLILATGGGVFELAGTPWLSVRSTARLLLVVAVLAGVEIGLQWRRAWRPRLAAGRQRLISSVDRGLVLVIAAGVALRLTEYVAPSIRLFPFLATERTFGRFLLTNLFVVAATLCLYALGRRIDDPRTALLAAIVFTLSPWTLYWGRFHVQQAAAVAMATLAAACFLGWLHGRGPVGLALASGVVAILLDPVNFWLIGVGAAMAAAGAGRHPARVVLALAAILGLSALARATFVPTADLWAPGVPAIGALSVGPATLFLLYDRVLTLVLPAGASLLFLLGMLGVTRRRDLLIPAWAGIALAWTAWGNNRHLVQADGYSAMVAAGSLAAARGASWILRRSSPRLLTRNLGWLAVVLLIASMWWGYADAFRRIPWWNTAVVSDRETVPLPWIGQFRAHGAWYLVSATRGPDESRDRRFLETMTERYGKFTEFGRVIFPILREPSDYHPAWRDVGPVPLFFEAEELPTKAGRIVPDGLAVNGYAVRADEAGAVVHGPYLAYPPGEYAVEFRVRIAPGEPPGVAGHVDVAGQAGRDVLARRDLAITGARAEREYRDIPLHVVIHRAEPLEFRVLSQGIRSIWVDRIRVRLSPLPAERVER